MSNNMRNRILHDLKRIAESINILISDLDEVGNELEVIDKREAICSEK